MQPQPAMPAKKLHVRTMQKQAKKQYAV